MKFVFEDTPRMGTGCTIIVCVTLALPLPFATFRATVWIPAALNVKLGVASVEVCVEDPEILQVREVGLLVELSVNVIAPPCYRRRTCHTCRISLI